VAVELDLPGLEILVFNPLHRSARTLQPSPERLVLANCENPDRDPLYKPGRRR
jgi:hypothetical protein